MASVVLGRLIANARKQRGMTQAEFSEITFIQPSLLGSIEVGRRNVSPDNIPAISRETGIPEDCVWYLSGLFPPDMQDIDIPLDVMMNDLRTLRRLWEKYKTDRPQVADSRTWIKSRGQG